MTRKVGILDLKWLYVLVELSQKYKFLRHKWYWVTSSFCHASVDFEFLEGAKECISSCSDINSEKEWTWSSNSELIVALPKQNSCQLRVWRVITCWSTSFGRDITIIVCVLQSILIPDLKKLKWRQVTSLFGKMCNSLKLLVFCCICILKKSEL